MDGDAGPLLLPLADLAPEFLYEIGTQVDNPHMVADNTEINYKP